MEKEKFILEKERIENEIKNLRKKIIELEDQYIESNKKFDIGQKVKVINKREPKEIGFVVGFEIKWNNNVEPKLVKCKKDGTPSQHKLFIWYGSTIEPLN